MLPRLAAIGLPEVKNTLGVPVNTGENVVYLGVPTLTEPICRMNVLTLTVLPKEPGLTTLAYVETSNDVPEFRTRFVMVLSPRDPAVIATAAVGQLRAIIPSTTLPSPIPVGVESFAVLVSVYTGIQVTMTML